VREETNNIDSIMHHKAVKYKDLATKTKAQREKEESRFPLP